RGALANPWIFRQLVEFELTGPCSPPGTFDERLQLLQRQFAYLCDLHPEQRAVVMFRKMGHWYLKGMRVRARHRHQLQTARTLGECSAGLLEVRQAGPMGASRTGLLTDRHMPVPAGPIAHW